jgi:hypothetical protein
VCTLEYQSRDASRKRSCVSMAPRSRRSTAGARRSWRRGRPRGGKGRKAA